MRDDHRLGYFPPGVKADENMKRHRGADPFGYFPPKRNPEKTKPPVEFESMAEAFDSVPAGVCPYCHADFRDKRNPAASLSSHIRAKMGDEVHPKK